MFLAVANSERLARIAPLVVLLVAGGLLRAWETRLAASAPENNAPPASFAAALPASWRAVAANACWLRANLAWERRDEAATVRLLERTVATDERVLAFWLNAARMIAYDFPSWRDEPGTPAAVRERTRHEAARRALAWLERAAVRHPARAAVFLEMAGVQLHVLGDRAEAARLFRRAAEQPDAPWHAARIHAELLRELGRPGEALAWLRGVLPALPADDPAARREVVRQRIAELERETGVR